MTQDKTPTRQTGPKTQQGKLRSSLNALKHGLTARSSHGLDAVGRDCPVELQPYLDKVRACYQPSDSVEEELVERIARCLWRLARTADMELRLLQRPGISDRPGASHESIVRYERMVDMQLHRAIKALERKRAALGAHVKKSQNEIPPRSK